MKELIDFIQDDDRLREERKKAKKNKDKYVGMSSEARMGGRFGNFRFNRMVKKKVEVTQIFCF